MPIYTIRSVLKIDVKDEEAAGAVARAFNSPMRAIREAGVPVKEFKIANTSLSVQEETPEGPKDRVLAFEIR